MTPVFSVRILYCRVLVSVDISGQFTLTKKMTPFKGKRFGDAEIFVLNEGQSNLWKIDNKLWLNFAVLLQLLLVIENYRKTVIESKMYLRKHIKIYRPIGYIKM